MATKSLGPIGLAELWSRMKTYVSTYVAGQTTPPVGYCLVNGGTNPADDGYSGTWELACVTNLGGWLLWPGSTTYPSNDQYMHSIEGKFYVWRRTA